MNILSALQIKNFRYYLIGQSISLLGTWLQYIALGWLTYRTTQSATWLGAISLAGGLPLLLIMPWSGVLIDKLPRKKLLITTQISLAILTFLLCILIYTHALSPLIILAFSFIGGIIFSIDQPLRQTLVSSLLPDKSLIGNAISLNAFINNFARITAPIIGSILILTYGEWFCFLVDACSFLLMAFILMGLSFELQLPSKKTESFYQSWKNGIAYLRSSPELLYTILITFILSSTIGTYTVLTPVITKIVYQGNITQQGYLLTCSGIGAILASLFMAKHPDNFKKFIFTIIGASLLACFALISLVSNSILIVGLFSIAALGLGMMTASIALNTLIQRIVIEEHRGQVMSLFSLAYFGAIPFSNFLAGYIVEIYGVKPALISISAVYCISVIFYFWKIFNIACQKPFSFKTASDNA